MTVSLALDPRVPVPALFRLMADRIPGIVWATDTELRFTASFGAGLDAVGLRPNELVGRTLQECLQNDAIRGPGLEAHARALRGESVDLQQTWQGRTYQVHVEPLRDHTGQVLGCLGFAHDITVQQQAEKELRRQDAQWRAVVDQAPVFITLLDHADKIQFINHPTSGNTRQDFLGKSVYDFVPPEFAATVRESVAQVRRSGEAAYYETVAGPQGRSAWYETRVGPVVVDGEMVAVSLISSDISERKQSETTLRDAAEHFREVAESAPFGVSIDDSQGHIVFTNAEFVKAFGYTLQDLPTQADWHRLAYPDPAYRERVFAIWQEDVRRMKSGEITRSPIREYRVTCRDGSVKQVEITFTVAGDFTYVVFHDITDRQRAEAALRASEAKYRRLHESMMDAFANVDLQGYLREFNDAYRQMLGYTAEELRALRYMDITPEPWHAFEAEIVRKQILPRGYSDIYEKEYRRKDGTVFPVELRVFLITDDRGQPAGMWAIVRDITARKRAEQELREAHDQLERRVRQRTTELTAANARLQAEVEQRRRAEEQLTLFQRFVEASTQGFGMADVDGRITYVNPFLARLFGRERPEDVIGTHVATYYPADYLVRREQEIIPALRRREHWQGEQSMMFPDGQLHATIHTIFPVRDEDGELFRTAAVITDITALKQVEEALRHSYASLRQSEAKYKALVESSPDAVAMADLDGRIMFASERAATQHGFAHPDELVGRSAADMVVPTDRERLAANIRRLIEEGIRRNDEYCGLRKDGTTFDIEISSAVIHNVAGKPQALMGVYRDITERKQAREKLERERRALRRMLMASDHERRLTTYELHDGVAQQLLGALFEFQAHEPRGQESQAHRAGLEALRQASAELRRIMNGLRTPVLDRFGLAEAIEDVAAQLRLGPGAPEITYRHRVQFARLEPTLENALFRIAQEALTNACRHSQSPKVRVALTQKGDAVTLEIRDWGTGFDSETVQEQRFGLDGIRERARLLGGRLTIQSSLGRGTVIRVTFPVVEAPPAAADQQDKDRLE